MIQTDLDVLETSDVVSNGRMNRTRGLLGLNSYVKELGQNPLDLLTPKGPQAAWLDLCCGSGLALAHASAQVPATVELVGVDIAEGFVRFGRYRSVKGSIRTFEPVRAFDVITCVHGLHYVGDKLEAIRLAASWLTDDGILIANLDKANLKGVNHRTVFRQPGMRFDGRNRRLIVQGRHEYTFPYRFTGFDLHAGPNYTHQDAVDSYYEKL